MTTTTVQRAQHLVLGALVADAAAMGWHWLYDQDHLQKHDPNTPEFRTPSAEDFAGVPGYFAHAGRQAGDLSHYGAQLMVMLQSLSGTGGRFDPDHYMDMFRQTFGYGGSYVGYIDHSTRDTLDNFTRIDDETRRQAAAAVPELDAVLANSLTTKALRLIKDHRPQVALSAVGQQESPQGTILREAFEEAVRITHNDDAVVAAGFRVLEVVISAPRPTGASDEQFPAISKLPPLVAAYAMQPVNQRLSFQDAVQQAITATSNHPNAVAYGHVSARIMQMVIAGQALPEAIAAGLEGAETEVSDHIKKALAMTDRSVNEVTATFGLACHLRYGVPSLLHNAITAGSFTEAVRRNILAGGDNCGRAMLLGAIMGVQFGVGGAQGIPQAWIDQLSRHRDINACLAGIT